MSCTSRLHSRLLNRGSDEDLGRWAWMQFKGTEKFNVVVLTAYHVSQKIIQV